MIAIPDSEPRKHKRAILRLTPQTLIELCKVDGSYTLSANGMPEDAKCVGIHVDATRDLFMMAVESDSFEEIEEGRLLPEISIQFTKHYSAAKP